MNKDYIIIANGIFLVKEIIKEASAGKTILALDGAADKLKKIGIKPDIILGDFDSIENGLEWGIHATFKEMKECTIPYLGTDGITIVPNKNQNYPDLIKAIHYCDAHGAKNITIICALGGRLDLHEAALCALSSEYRVSRHIVLLNDQSAIQFVKDATITVHGNEGDNVAILGYPTATLTCSGLKYSVKDYKLSIGNANSISNSLISPTATITIQGEALIIMPPQLESQRIYMQHSEADRLLLRLRDLDIS